MNTPTNSPTVTGGETVAITTGEGNVDPNRYTVIKSERSVVYLKNETTGQEPIKVHKSRISKILAKSSAVAEDTKTDEAEESADESVESEAAEVETDVSASEESDDSEGDEDAEATDASAAEVDESESESEEVSDEDGSDTDNEKENVVDTKTATAKSTVKPAVAKPAAAKAPAKPASKPAAAKAPAKPVVSKPKKSKPMEKFDFAGVLDKGDEIWSKEMAFDHSHVKAQAHCIIDPKKRTFTTFNTYNGSKGKGGGGQSEFKLASEAELDKKRMSLSKKGYIQMTSVEDILGDLPTEEPEASDAPEAETSESAES